MGELLFFACTKKSNQKKVLLPVNSELAPWPTAIDACTSCAAPISALPCASPSSLVAWCHRSTRRFLRRVSLNWPSLANSDSRASLFSTSQGGLRAGRARYWTLHSLNRANACINAHVLELGSHLPAPRPVTA